MITQGYRKRYCSTNHMTFCQRSIAIISDIVGYTDSPLMHAKLLHAQYNTVTNRQLNA